jgi:hypothetical protein
MNYAYATEVNCRKLGKMLAMSSRSLTVSRRRFSVDDTHCPLSLPFEYRYKRRGGPGNAIVEQKGAG